MNLIIRLCLAAGLLQVAAPFNAPAQLSAAPVLIQTITNPIVASNVAFGFAVAPSGTNAVLIGAPYDDSGATDAGRAYRFNLGNSNVTAFTNSTPAANERFGWAVAEVGTNRVLVGAPGNGTGANGAGVAYLFNVNGTLVTTITNPSPSANAQFGGAVAALDPERVIVGAEYSKVGNVFAAGEGHLFRTNGALLTTFSNPNPAPGGNEGFGHAVAAVGTDRILIGAQQKLVGLSRIGAAYLFNTNGSILATFGSPAPQANEYFGYTLASLGTDRVLVGAPFRNAGPGLSAAGAAYLFDTNGTLLTTFTNPTPVASEFFGNSVATAGPDRIVIGGYGAAGNPRMVYLFNTNGSLLGAITNPPGGDLVDNSLAALGANKLVVGARNDDAGATDSGAVYVYQLSAGQTQPRLDQMGKIAPNQFRFRVTGDSNQNYTVQVATVLTNWSDLLTTNTTTNVFFITDPNATNSSRVYRVKVN